MPLDARKRVIGYRHEIRIGVRILTLDGDPMQSVGVVEQVVGYVYMANLIEIDSRIVNGERETADVDIRTRRDADGSGPRARYPVPARSVTRDSDRRPTRPRSADGQASRVSDASFAGIRVAGRQAYSCPSIESANSTTA